MKTIDDVAIMSPNQLVSWFMIASYAYYRTAGDDQVMTDPTFDYLVQRLKENYDKADHPHKKFVTRENLEAGSGFDVEFPNIVIGAYRSYMREYYEITSK